MLCPILEVQSIDQLHACVRRASQVLREGGIVVFPTETVYGIGAVATNPQSVRRLRSIKQREDEQPFTLHIGSPDDVRRYADVDGHPLLARLCRKLLPGPITLVIDVPDHIAQEKISTMGYDPAVGSELYFQGTIGLRCPDDPVAMELLSAVHDPVVASSANHSGDPPPTNASMAAAAVGEEIDLLIDGGPCRYAKASTIIRVRADSYEVLREGIIDERYLQKVLRRTILFVCSGNTCRSPMAEAIARYELSQRLHVPIDQLETAHIAVASAGAFTGGGSPMTHEAVQALRKMGIPVLPHASSPLTPQRVRSADAVFGMTASHVQAAHAVAPDAADRIALLSPDGEAIDDPIGASVDVYVECAQRMQKFIRTRLDELGWFRAGEEST